MAGREKISVVGLGHVGLPTALGLAELGWDVTGVDSDKEKILRIGSGEPPFYEPGLAELLRKHLQGGRFRAGDSLDEGAESSSILFLCVGTPQRETGEADLSQVESAVRVIARHRNGYKLIVEKSTVPAVTAQWIKRTVRRYGRARSSVAVGAGRGLLSAGPANGGEEAETFEVASNPEFLQEGRALEDFFRPHRVVCGVESGRARRLLGEIYRPLGCPVLFTDLSTAELIKHTANAFLATKVSFINTVAELCEAIGADVTQVAYGIGLDPRIGRAFLQAGVGYGGYCLPKDLRAFIRLADEHQVNFGLLREVERVNRERIPRFLAKIRETLWVVKGKTIGVLGLAFKPGTDDIREAPSVQLLARLLDEGALLQVHDPRAMPTMQRVFPEEVGRLMYCGSPYDAARGAEALIVMTEWEDYGRLDLVQVRDLMEVPVLLDGRNLYDPGEARRLGFEYRSVGR